MFQGSGTLRFRSGEGHYMERAFPSHSLSSLSLHCPPGISRDGSILPSTKSEMYTMYSPYFPCGTWHGEFMVLTWYQCYHLAKFFQLHAILTWGPYGVALQPEFYPLLVKVTSTPLACPHAVNSHCKTQWIFLQIHELNITSLAHFINQSPFLYLVNIHTPQLFSYIHL